MPPCDAIPAEARGYGENIISIASHANAPQITPSTEREAQSTMSSQGLQDSELPPAQDDG
eukprot:8607048-Lingulodinium_polyedra.AAC.1